MSTKYRTLLDLMMRPAGVESSEAAIAIDVTPATVRGMVRDLAQFVRVARVRLQDRRRVVYRAANDGEGERK